MTASAISSGHGTRRNFVSAWEVEWLILESVSLGKGDGDSEPAHDALVCEEDVEI